MKIQDDARVDTQTRPLNSDSLPTLTANRSAPELVSSDRPRYAPITAPGQLHNTQQDESALLDVDQAFNPESMNTAKALQLASEAIRLLQDRSPVGPPPTDEPRQLNEEDRFGQAPADADNRQVFLRTAAVLLQPGQLAADFGLQYQWREFDFPIVTGGLLTTQRVRTRKLFVPLQLRYGAHENTQFFVNMPFGMSHFETANITSDFETSKFGIGDVNLGVNYQVHTETDETPAVVLTLNGIAPTGDDPFGLTSIGLSDASALGSGFWGAGASALVIKTYDPLVVFWGMGYLHRFDRSYLGVEFDPGHVATYQFGTGFAVNDRITLSTAFFGAFETTTKADGVSISNSSQEPFAIRLALTHVRNRCCIIEPFVTFGLNDDAPNADFGVLLTRRF